MDLFLHNNRNASYEIKFNMEVEKVDEFYLLVCLFLHGDQRKLMTILDIYLFIVLVWLGCLSNE